VVAWLVVASLLAHAVLALIARAQGPRPASALPGATFQSAETQAQEKDLAANPGMLWVERGAALWARPDGVGNRACADCHGAGETSMRGVAARYPAIHAASGELRNIELQINACRSERQQAQPLTPESDALLGLAAFVTHQSRGLPRKVATDGAAAPWLERGRRLWHERQGQLDLACAQCHDDNAGRRLRGDRISQGQSDGWPAYRLEWQTFGSLHRRLRACSLGVRAEVLDYSAPEYLALELYIAWRGEGLPISSPGIRR
jgi:sulfur-oxidizing protein SoxA